MSHREYVAGREARDPDFRDARKVVRPLLEAERTRLLRSLPWWAKWLVTKQ